MVEKQVPAISGLATAHHPWSLEEWRLEELIFSHLEVPHTSSRLEDHLIMHYPQHRMIYTAVQGS